jgi:hypothetical protein
MIIEAEGYRIDFKDAINTFKFDEIDKSKSTYHGVTALKAVDVITELESAYLFIEIKDYTSPEEFDYSINIDRSDPQHRGKYVNWLKNYLKYKFRDSFLYRYAENKLNKPIYYLCLINFDNALNIKLEKDLIHELPIGIQSRRWHTEIVHKCHVLNELAWNRNFPKWPIHKIS